MWGCSGFVPAAFVFACLILPWSIAILRQPVRVVDRLAVPPVTSKVAKLQGSTYDGLLWFVQVSVSWKLLLGYIELIDAV